MNLEETRIQMAAKKVEAEAFATAYNEAVNDKDVDKINKAQSDLDQACKEYNTMSEAYTFEVAKGSDVGPMMAAIKMFTYTTIRAKKDKVEDSNFPVVSVDEVEKPIDLGKLHKYCGGIGVDHDWIYAAEKFNMQMTQRAKKDVGDEDDVAAYSISKKGEKYIFNIKLDSKTKLLKAVQELINMMIGEEYKATSHDAAWLDMVYCKKGREALTITAATHKQMRQNLMEIAFRIVNNAKYKVDYKTKKVKA